MLKRIDEHVVSTRSARRLMDEDLHELLTWDLWRPCRSILERELRRREAWQAPAAVSVAIAALALIISASALGVSVWNALR